MSYLMELKSWMDSTTSAYREFIPRNFASSFMPSTSFYYTSDTNTDRTNEMRMYNMALSLYAGILKGIENQNNKKQDRGEFYHWVPVENHYCTQLIDRESGRTVTVAKSRAGTSLSGYHHDIEANFGRGMGSEAVKMMYDGKLHDELHTKRAG